MINVAGTKMSAANSSLLVSTGVPSLDAIIGQLIVNSLLHHLNFFYCFFYFYYYNFFLLQMEVYH